MMQSLVVIVVAVMAQAPGQPTSAAPEKPAAVQFTPYGLLATHLFLNSHAVVNADSPIAATGLRGPAIGATVRQSRLGLKLSVPAVAAALGARTVEGVVEVDFVGGYYPFQNVTYYAPLPRLRLFTTSFAFDGGWRLVLGQDWVLFAPQNPDSLNHLALPFGANAGNIFMRLPQVRVEKSFGGLLLAAAVLAPADASPSGPQPIVFLRDPNAGDRSLVPSLQARAAYTLSLLGESSTFGLSGHYGQEAVAPGRNVPIWGAAADVVLALTKQVTIKAEAFTGANLDGFLSPAAVVGAAEAAAPVTTVGGFVQVALRLGKVGVFLTAAAEDPQAPAATPLPTNAIDLNRIYGAAITYTLAPQTLVGFEVNRIETDRAPALAAIANHYNATFQLGF